MNQPPAEIGAAIADIDTPALVVDLDALTQRGHPDRDHAQPE